jgi:hypothetical protein
MINKILTYYVDYPTAKLLRKFGFNVPCELYYEWYPHYKGEPLSFDDECELKSEGKEKEIKYKALIQKMYNTNTSLGYEKNCSCPSLEVVRSWVLKNFNISFVIKPYYDSENKLLWKSEIYSIKEKTIDLVTALYYGKTDTKILADSIEYALILIREYLKNNEENQ